MVSTREIDLFQRWSINSSSASSDMPLESIKNPEYAIEVYNAPGLRDAGVDIDIKRSDGKHVNYEIREETNLFSAVSDDDKFFPALSKSFVRRKKKSRNGSKDLLAETDVYDPKNKRSQNTQAVKILIFVDEQRARQVSL